MGVFMTEKQVQIFLTVAKSLNISRSAEELYTTQPYLSRQIINLESDLGVKLFYRKNRKLELTESGKELYNGMQEILRQRELLLEKVKKSGELEFKDIKIGYMHVLLTGHMPETIQSFKHIQENINIELKNLNAKAILENINNKDIDIGLVLTVGDCLPKNINLISLASSMVYIAMTKTHRLAKKSFVTYNDIISEKFIFLPNELSPLMLTNEKNPFSIEARVFKQHVFAENMFNAISLVKMGVGIAPVAKDFSFHKYENLVFVPFTGMPNMNYSLIWRKDDNSPNTEKLIDHIKSKPKPSLVY